MLNICIFTTTISCFCRISPKSSNFQTLVLANLYKIDNPSVVDFTFHIIHNKKAGQRPEKKAPADMTAQEPGRQGGHLRT